MTLGSKEMMEPAVTTGGRKETMDRPATATATETATATDQFTRIGRGVRRILIISEAIGISPLK
jgi:hypothetical protein